MARVESNSIAGIPLPPNKYMDTVEQTIEQLLSTVKELSTLADKAIYNISSVECKSAFLKELDEIMDKHYNHGIGYVEAINACIELVNKAIGKGDA